jgi:hypothetical protein
MGQHPAVGPTASAVKGWASYSKPEHDSGRQSCLGGIVSQPSRASMHLEGPRAMVGLARRPPRASARFLGHENMGSNVRRRVRDPARGAEHGVATENKCLFLKPPACWTGEGGETQPSCGFPRALEFLLPRGLKLQVPGAPPATSSQSKARKSLPSETLRAGEVRRRQPQPLSGK